MAQPIFDAPKDTQVTLDLDRAMVTMYSTYDQLYTATWAQSPLLCVDEGCPSGYFCGRDSQCHRLGNCEDYFRYGPSEMTGVQEDHDNGILLPALNCTTEYRENPFGTCGLYGGNDGDWPSALLINCLQGSYLCPIGENLGQALPFSRMCTAEPNPDQTYLCFDTVAMKEADIVAYEERILENYDCPNEDEADFPGYHGPSLLYIDAYSNNTHRTNLYPFSRAHLIDANKTSSLIVNRERLSFLLFSELRGSPPEAFSASPPIPCSTSLILMLLATMFSWHVSLVV